MRTFWRRTTGTDSLYGGAISGAIVGLLIASSSITWIQSIVTAVTNIIPVEYQFTEIFPYLLWGLIGAIGGYINDRY